MFTPAFQSGGPHCLLQGNISLALVFDLTFLSLTVSDFFTRMLRLPTKPYQPVQVVKLVLSSSQQLDDRDLRHSWWEYGRSSHFIIAVSPPDTPPPPANLPPYPQTLPSVMLPQPASEPSKSSVPPAPTGELQSRLQETQNALSSYTDKFHVLDSLIAEHDGFKHDVDLIKVFMEERKREAQAREQHQNEEFSSGDDDTRSVATVVPHELERVDEEDEEAAAEHEDRRRSSREVGRPRTPEPSLTEFDDDDHHRSKPSSHIPDDIIRRLETLSSQLESALELFRSLQAQQASAQNMIQLLENKVTELQQLVHATQTKVDDQHEAHQAAIKEAIESVRVPEQEREKERESLTEMINEWSVEKDRLRRARDEWKLKTKNIEGGILARVKSRLSLIQQRDSHPFMNGSAKPNGQGLVTPPSPRSLSPDSMRPRSRKKRNPLNGPTTEIHDAPGGSMVGHLFFINSSPAT